MYIVTIAAPVLGAVQERQEKQKPESGKNTFRLVIIQSEKTVRHQYPGLSGTNTRGKGLLPLYSEWLLPLPC